MKSDSGTGSGKEYSGNRKGDDESIALQSLAISSPSGLLGSPLGRVHVLGREVL